MSITSDKIMFAFPIALSPSEELSLYCSIHSGVSNPSELFQRLQGADPKSLAILDASKVVSLNQLLVAANLAASRKHDTSAPTAWDVVYLVAPSNHMGHILRDFSFAEKPAQELSDAIVLWIAPSGQEKEYGELIESFKIPNSSQEIEFYLSQQAASNEHRLIQLYKLSQDEVLTSTLESAVLMRIASKMHM